MASDNEENEALVLWASKFNSELNSRQKQLLESIKVMNSFMKAFDTGETLTPVGSCMDGSKVNVPRDHGDIDVLVISGNTLLSEHLFKYIPDNPAFLRIQMKDEHLELFRHVESVENQYLPAAVLQEMEKEFFSLIKVMTTPHLLPNAANDTMRLVRKSKVGFERQDMTGVQSELDGILKLPKQKWGFSEGLFNMLTYLNNGIDVMKGESSRDKKSEKTDFKKHEKKSSSDDSDQSKTYKGVGDILNLLSDTINKFQGFGDTDSEGSDLDSNDSNAEVTQMDDMETTRTRHNNIVDDEYETIECDSSIGAGVTDETNSHANGDGVSMKGTETEATLSSLLDTDKTGKMTCELQEKDCMEVDVTCCVTIGDECSDKSIKTREFKETEMKTKRDEGNDISDVELGTQGKCEHSKSSIAEETTPVDYENIESADFVPAFLFSGWPKPAAEWLHRVRKWPTDDVIQEVFSAKCQVIVKPLPTGMNNERSYTPNENDVMFRLSFASQELILARSLNEIQKTCWKILKAFQKSFFETSPRVMKSYLWKNAMFWVCEEVESSFWVHENLLKCVVLTLEFAQNCLKSKTFPQYFIRDMNLIGHCDDADREKTMSAIEMLKLNPVVYLRQFIESPPKPGSFRVTPGDIESIAQSKDNNHDFDVIKVQLLNALGNMMRQMNDGGDTEVERRRMVFENGASGFIDTIKEITDKGRHDEGDPRRDLQNDFFDSFKELFTTVCSEDSSDEDSGFSAPLKKVASSMLKLVSQGNRNKEQKETRANLNKKADKWFGKERINEEFDLD